MRVAKSSAATFAGSAAWVGRWPHPHVVFYVGVPNVGAALQKAESLGGKRAMGPEQAPGLNLVVGHFTDPKGNLIGLAGPA